nr:MAG TPA: tail protein [Caudoviricetes sp.]
MTDTPRIAILSAYDKVCAFLDNDSPDCLRYYDETLHTYLQGSAYTFEFTTFTDNDDAQYLVVGNKLSFRWKNKDYYLNIVTTEKQEYELKVTAYGLVFELLNEEVDAYEGSSLSFAQYIHDYGFEHSFTIGLNEVSDKRISHKWEGSETILARLYSTANVFDAELEFVTQLENDYSLKDLTLNVYRKHDDSHQGMGRDRRHEILRYGKEIRGIHKTSDVTELYTGIRPMGKDGLRLTALSGKKEYDSDGNVEFQVSGNNLLAPQARDRFPSTLITDRAPGTDMYIVKIWSYDTDNVNVLYGQALAELKKYVNPKVEYEIDGYIEAEIGDTFTVEDSEYTPALYLEARIVEQEISFTNVDKCRTTFDNFSEVSSKVSNELLIEMNRLIEENKTYQLVVSSSDGIVLPEAVDHTVLTAYVRDKGKDITDQFTIKWYVDSNLVFTGRSVTVEKSSLKPSVTYHVEALSALDIVKASYEVTVAGLLNGADGVNSFLHIAYANSSDGRVDFSLTDSNRKFIGQYVDENKYDSEDPTKYRWSAIKGADGQSFVSAEEQFYYSTSQTELVGGEWFVGNVVYQSDKFLWKRWKCTYANPSEIKYTKAIFDNTWNEIDAKIGEIHTQVSQANTQSKEAVDKATQAQTDASKANQLANTANTQSSEAKKLAQDANASTGKAQKQIDAIKGDITDSKQQIQGAVDKANANANEIATVKETYATKVDLTNESKSIHADVSTEIEKKVGELSTTVSETYASKSDLTTLEGSMNTQFKQTADTISTQASSIEKLQSDTTQAQKDITEATKKATDAQTQASTALSNAQSAQTLADEAKKKADSAQTNLDSANQELADAKANLKSVTGRVDASETEIASAKTRLTNAETAVKKAQSDATTAQGKAQTAINNAKAAQSTADTAKANADKAQKDLADLTNKVTSNTTAIEQNSKAIKLQAQSITKTSNKIDNLQIGGRNLLLSTQTFKPNFGLNGTSETPIKDTDGFYYVSLRNAWSNYINQYVDLILGQTYTISFYAKCDSNVQLEIKDDSKNNVVLAYAAINSKDWKLYSTTFVVTTKKATPIVCFLTRQDSATIYIKKIKLELGNKNTDWSPAPEDLDSKIDNIQIGGRNLLKNSHSVEQTYSYPSSNYVDQCNWVTSIPLNGDTYTLSFWAKSTVAGDTIRVHFYNPSNITHCVGSQGQVSGNIDGQCDFTLSTVLTKYWVTYTIPKGGNSARSVIIPRMFSDFGKGTVSVKWEKLEEGNKATDWTPAPEDVDNAINTERTERQSAIETKANEITSKVSETYVSNSALNHYKEEVSTQFSQTKNDFTWTVNKSVEDTKNEFKGQISSVNGRVDGLKQTTDNVNSYMSFDNDGLTLGKSDSAFKTKITNEEWSIQKNGAKVTYINDQTMYITDGQFTQSLKVGAFGFVPRANGSLDFKKVG